MYTYYLRPVLVGHEAQLSSQAGAREGHRLDASSVGDSSLNAAFLNEGLAESVHSWEVQLVLEYCDQGSLRQLLNNNGAFALPDGGRDMLLILDTALDVARAMVHLHSENIIHSDLKVCGSGCGSLCGVILASEVPATEDAKLPFTKQGSAAFVPLLPAGSVLPQPLSV